MPSVQLQIGGISQVLRELPENRCGTQKSVIVDAEEPWQGENRRADGAHRKRENQGGATRL